MRRIVPITTLAALLVLAGCIGGAGGGSSVGLAVGGAQDANDFRNNINAGYVPQPASLTAEGLYHDYYFDTGQDQACNATFCPSYSRAVTEDPLSGEREQYVTVGLNSGLSATDFERKPLNLVVVVDTSGSMGSPFTSYHYDDGTETQVDRSETKMETARQAISTLTTHLGDDDRLGVVAYSNNARTVVEMQSVGDADMDSISDEIHDMEAGGGTNLDAGMQTAESMLEPYRNPDRTERETRVIYLTDAMPNLGQTDGDGLAGRLADDAADGVYSTFIGVGVDFNARFVETVNEVEGANHYVVRSPNEFADRMDDGFEYMVTPLVFDLSLELESDAYEIDAVYGSPNSNATDGELVNVNTLFPSRTTENKTEGGVILVQLERTADADGAAGTGGDQTGSELTGGELTGGDDSATSPVTLRASYETRDGQHHTTERTVAFAAHDAPYYETTGVRKAVVLSRYVDLARNWMAYERKKASDDTAEPPSDGIEHQALGEWEQQSVALTVAPVYRDRFQTFREYFAAEAVALGDDSLRRDLAILDTLATTGTNETTTGDGNEIESGDNSTTTEGEIARQVATVQAGHGADSLAHEPRHETDRRSRTSRPTALRHRRSAAETAPH